MARIIYIIIGFVYFSYSQSVFAAVDVDEIINQLMAGPTNPQEYLEVLAKNSSESGPVLISNLKPISLKEISPDQFATHPAEMKIIWSLRALRYIYRKDYSSKTNYVFKSEEELQVQHFIKASYTDKTNHEVMLFGVWMSRDIIYLAPEDAQINIIKQWKEWSKSHSETLSPVSGPTKDDLWWYGI
jgi:hypothetical protein